MSAHGKVIHRAPCASCGSRDNVAVYEDGYEKCFGTDCDYYSMPLKEDDNADSLRDNHGQRADADAAGHRLGDAGRNHARDFLLDLRVEPLPARGITLETCEKFKYEKGKYKGKPCQVANYYRGGSWVCAKLRFPDKGFMMLGDGANAPLYGQHLWRDGGKYLVITEGEIDALSVSQVQGNKWPVVSIPNGAQSAVATVKRELEWVEKFETVIFMFDMDEPGQAAAKAAAELLTPGKARIAHLPMKDANELLLAGRVAELNAAKWDAKVYRPDGILNAEELIEEMVKGSPSHGLTLPFPRLNQMLRGLHAGRIITITAGEGIGKSTLARAMAYELGMVHGENVGYLGLEENVRETAQHLVGLHMGERLAVDFRTDEELTDEDRDRRREAAQTVLGSGRYFFYDHFGSTDVDNLLSRVRYLSRSCDCRWIVLDHLSIVVSSMEDEKRDERKLIDRAMTLLRTLVEETGIGLILVNHLSRTTDGKGYDEGARPRLSKLRGSAGVGQLSDVVISLERDMQADDPTIMVARVLKSRQVGITGAADTLRFNQETGRLDVVDPALEEFGNVKADF